MTRKAPAVPERAREERRRRPRVPRLLRAVGMALAGWAAAQELQKPKQERTWHGTLAGVVPYDLRRPTLARIRERVWAPQDARVVMPRVFGVGWTLNLGRLARLLRDRLARPRPHR